MSTMIHARWLSGLSVVSMVSTAHAIELKHPSLEHYVGYAHKLTRGVTHLGWGLGMGVGVDVWRLHVSARSFLFAGAADIGRGPESYYHARAFSFASQVALGVPLRTGWLYVAPSIFIGGTALFGSTTLQVAPSGYSRRDLDRRYDFQLGPEVTALVQMERFSVGILAQAGFVHTHVAGPIFSGYAVWGVNL